MSGDRERVSRLRAEQDRALGRYLRHQVSAYSPYYQARFERAAVDLDAVRHRRDLPSIPLTSLADVAGAEDSAALVLRPDPARIRSRGERRLALAMRWAGLTGQTAKLMRTRIDPLYKPIHWIVTGEDILVGASAADVDRLAELGRRWLEVAGIRPLDVLVSILPPGPNLAFWQLSLGARRGGVSSLMLPAAPAPADVEHLRPTALAGRPGDLALLLARLVEDGHTVPGLRTVLTAGDQLDGPTRAQLRELAGRASGGEQPEVVAAWAPPGVRALWVECRGGIALHTWPDAEALEVVDPQGAAVAAGQEGEIAWTALGWRGTVFVRLRTGARGQLDESPCPVCGRTTPRLSVRSWLPPFAAILDAEDALTGWQAELRTVVGGQELVLFVVPRDPAGDGLEPVLRELDRRLSVAQFVVLDGAALEARLAAHDGVLVVDRRSDGG